MIELIEVNALNENFETHCRKGECFVEALLHALEDTPRVDAVPVVRCKDCNYSRRATQAEVECGVFAEGLLCTNKKNYTIFPNGRNENDFCCFGERKMDDEVKK